MRTATNEEVVEIEQLAVKVRTAAKVMDVSESTVRKLIREGKLEAVEVGSDKRVTGKSIKALLGS